MPQDLLSDWNTYREIIHNLMMNATDTAELDSLIKFDFCHVKSSQIK